MDFRARHAAVQDVADDRHLQLAEVALVLPNGEHVEHGLGGMLMPPVAGIDHGNTW